MLIHRLFGIRFHKLIGLAFFPSAHIKNDYFFKNIPYNSPLQNFTKKKRLFIMQLNLYNIQWMQNFSVSYVQVVLRVAAQNEKS